MQYGKYSPVKYANFVYFLYLRTRKPMTFETNVVGFRKYMQNLENSQGYISRILQDFATKFFNFAVY